MNTRRLRTAVLCAAAVLAPTVVPVGIPSADAGPLEEMVSVKSQRLCDRPATRTPTPGASLERHDPKDEWLANEAAQAAVTRLNTLVAGRSDVSGVVVDDQAQRVIVVRDPDIPHSSKLVTDLVSAVKGDLKVVVQPACRNRNDAAGVQGILQGRAWHPNASKINFGFGWDPAVARYAVTLPPGAVAEAKALEERFGDLVYIRYENAGLGSGSRFQDGSAHYGGARINNPASGGGGTCTTGFTVVSNTGKHYMLTAGHCFDSDGIQDGMIEGNGHVITSGAQTYGRSSDQRAPEPDAVLIGSQIPLPAQTYDRQIYVDPCCPSVRSVIAAYDVGVGQYVCASGSWTLAVCGARVDFVNLSFCSSYGCSGNTLTYARRPGVLLTQPGDSGGPIYQRSGTNGAIANGIVELVEHPSGGDYVWYTPVGRIINGFWQMGLQFKVSGGPA